MCMTVRKRNRETDNWILHLTLAQITSSLWRYKIRKVECKFPKFPLRLNIGCFLNSASVYI